ncbi:MAG TPA: VOC family protein [Pyrinomonadaceae bacterium]|nr:VOC family protein [Pyrinomonadaceae bacterium]
MTTSASAQAAGQKIKPCLWFDNQAEEAVNLYCSIFKDSKVLSQARYGDAGPGPKGQIVTMTFQLAGQEFMALNGGPAFKFTEAVSLVVKCDTQEELDEYWEKLLANGGSESQCGWLKDKFGLSWQIIPTVLEQLMSGDPARANRVMTALLKMVKLDIAKLKEAAAG